MSDVTPIRPQTPSVTATQPPPVRLWEQRGVQFWRADDVIAFVDWCTENTDPINAIGTEVASKALRVLLETPITPGTLTGDQACS